MCIFDLFLLKVLVMTVAMLVMVLMVAHDCFVQLK